MSVSAQKNLALRPGERGATAGAFHIEDIYPSIECGRYPVKRLAGEMIDVWADIYRSGHDVVVAELIWRREGTSSWQRAPMVRHDNDRWDGRFSPTQPGRYEYAIEAWTDTFATWRHGFELKAKAGQDVHLDALEGAALLALPINADEKTSAFIRRQLDAYLQSGKVEALLTDDLAAALTSTQERPDLTRSRLFPLVADRERAVAGAWYEMVPRSQSAVPGQHGTFRDCIARLPDVAAMGFDVLYFTPIHPIGTTNRKGSNNALKAAPGDPGSFYAIGSQDGGHTAVHPELGTLDDFRALVDACKAHDLEIALDIAVQCSPDHPWLREHEEWFRKRPDGSMRYAENPPKKYEDIVNPDFGCDDAGSLWNALRDVILFWVDHGVRIFRVDNPHTKPFNFWEWLIREVQTRDPGVIFLAEAFTRPKVMKGLAKLGFTQSYTYFTWRTQKWEIEAYLNELTNYPERDYYRPNFFVNTPDILPYHLQGGEPWMFKSRVALAATLSGNYGIYNGFELLEHEPLPGREEYLDSEKYEIKTRNWNKPGNIKRYITAINEARRANPALRQTRNLRFLPVENANIIAFVKYDDGAQNVVVGAISLVRDAQEFWLPLADIELHADGGPKPPLALENLFTGERRAVEWGGTHLRIDPMLDPALLFRCII
ncbi:alpha-1,4-glucan--maltose-1-phosphate maltosyltransferase [Bradyrhizobium sp. LHD-71]|uniref:alpha-1,4-glucan--maltose-1-phosphate maltosyltransferase n=1 Tax=Bradyrhizobium sp. LHD-71 TaxID=3072141 RepID=UPI00280DD5CE|nr:alpha-1,4-glucan--maltose-1-phosphate maltosyltransferase [Bradyrhizobium sp. LHD-71]MDQ8727705.1 alpha-1,4-glucan--maltose-1-phosphate maltosyltransferase [Bradyrhizobium sp. LHD-71]